MKTLATAVSLFVLFDYVALMRAAPDWGLLHPRGGIVMLGLSLAIANAAIWLAAQPHRSPSFKLQLAAAGWIWLIVQGGGIAYVYSQMDTT